MQSHHIQQAAKFSVSGLLATGLHVLVASSIVAAGLGSLVVANTVAFLIATCLSYRMNARWSFKAETNARTIFRYLVVTAVGFALTALVSLVADMYHLQYLVGILLVVLVVPPCTFLLHKLWTFRAPRNEG